jgi:5'-nucleotidase
MEGSAFKSRRDFLKKSSYASIALIGSRAFGIEELPKDETRSLVIAHTNDMHSHIDPFPSDDPKYPGLGGMSDRATLIDQLRNEHGDILLLDAGDIFQGTPYFNFFGGSLELELMSKMGYDAATMGNHDFDGGMDGFIHAQEKADFPFICSNYDFTDTVLEDRTIPYKILRKKGIRVGIFGLGVKLDGLVDDRLCKGVRYDDPIEIAKEKTRFLRTERECDLVICLSHLGYSYAHDKVSDLVLGDSVEGIDLIIGGHTHTFLDSPTIIEKSEKMNTYINQVGWAGVKLGVLEFTFAKEQKIKGQAMQSMDVKDSA